MYKIFDDIADLEQTKEFYNIVSQNKFPWYLGPSVDPGEEIRRTIDKPYFIDQTRFDIRQNCLVHKVFNDFKYNSAIAETVEKHINDFCGKTGITHEGIIRAQFNLVFQSPKSLPSLPHVDNQFVDHGVLLFYLHDTDGDTLILDDYANEIARVTPKQNRVLAFDGTHLHCGGTPIEQPTRMVINCNLYKMRIPE